jgi:formylglycine-generating enzyme required for sulfatase activity/predicted Ser/Thr protein kinase
MRLTTGTRVRRYQIEAPIGAGGMGEVYLARDTELGRSVALKILPHFEGDADERVARFLQEAKAATALNHPNIAHLYDAGEENGIRFMAMEYVEGQTLRERTIGRAMSIDEALDIAIQIASALASAHGQGIIHRDIKPDNVMLRPDGYVKVLDFGLAKLTATSSTDATMPVHTNTGVVMGTVHYMSPEQLRAEPVDARSDVFSLGVLMYELVAGRRPFESASPSGVIAAIFMDEPPPIANVPPTVNAILRKALAKKREDRYASAGEMLAALKEARGTGRIRSGDVPTQALTAIMPAERRPIRRIVTIAIVAAVAAILAAVAIHIAIHQRSVDRARAALPRIERLTEEKKFFEAYDLASSVAPLLPGEERLTRSLDRICAELTVKSNPGGATVYLRRFVANGEAPRAKIGTTPIEKLRVPQGEYLLTVEKQGFETIEHPISLVPVQFDNRWLAANPLTVEETLRTDTPTGMVFVAGATRRLGGSNRPTDMPMTVEDFFVDKYEVSNRDFARFIAAGGYRRPELWKNDFVANDGRTLTFAEAIAQLHDTTGLPGPRGWANGNFPPGRDNYPVSDVTWYEAEAYAEWTGRKLPTIFEWDVAARPKDYAATGYLMPWGPAYADVNLRANFRGQGPMPVDSLPFGGSPSGAQNMAGNVAEWCRNELHHGHASRGGSWDSAAYQFQQYAAYPPFYSAPNVGFRCVKEIGKGDQGDLAFNEPVRIPEYTPVPDAEWQKLKALYDYTKVRADVRVVETKTAPAWTRQKLSMPLPNGDISFAYLYLPKGFPGPSQVIHFVPMSDVDNGLRDLTTVTELMLEPHIRSGRAVLAVILEGYLQRPDRPGTPALRVQTPEFGDFMAARVTEWRRWLDYLETRHDVDTTKLAFYGPSAGATAGMILCTVDPRYKAIYITGSGIREGEKNVVPSASRINFLPHVTAPVLMLHGRYDEIHPLRPNAESLYNLLRCEKHLEVFDGGHLPPPSKSVPLVNAFLDEKLGPVRQ